MQMGYEPQVSSLGASKGTLPSNPISIDVEDKASVEMSVENGYCLLELSGHSCSDRSCNYKHQNKAKGKITVDALLKTLHLRPRFSIAELYSQHAKHSKESSKRYFEKTDMHSDELELQVKRNPMDSEAWIKFALSQLPDHLDDFEKNKLSGCVGPSLKVLNKALEHIPDNQHLAELQLELIQYGGTDQEVRISMERAVSKLPNCQEIWWRFFKWETVISRRQGVLLRMLPHFFVSTSQNPTDGKYSNVFPIMLNLILSKLRLSPRFGVK
jgi:hypothetical protein